MASAYPGSIDLLLTDVAMPGEDGFEVARYLRESRPDLVVAYMSGYADRAKHGMPVGVNGDRLLRKPFTPEELLAHVTRAVGQDRGASEATAG